jgi:hypothetical protein
MTVSVAFVVYFVLPSFPATTPWHSEEERAYTVWSIENDIGSNEAGYVEPTMLLATKLVVMDYRTWLFVAMQHCILLSQTVTFFPSLVNTLEYPRITTLLLTAPIWVATFIFNMVILWSISRTKERHFHMIGSMAVTIIGNIMLITIHLRGPRLFSMFQMAMGAQPAFMIILTCISNMFPQPLWKCAAIIAIVNMIGNCSNIYGSYLYPKSAAPQYEFGGATIAGVGALCCLLELVLRCDLIKENKKIDGQAALLAAGPEVERPEATGPVHPSFKGDEERRELAGSSGICIEKTRVEWEKKKPIPRCRLCE